MTRFTDGKRTIEITMETLSNHQSFEEEFFEVGGLEYDEDTNTYKVADVDYLVEQAEDMYNREGDYSYDERRTAKNAISVYVWDETNGCSMLDVTDTFELERWTDTYQYGERICNAEDEELLRWADEAECWDDFSMGCLHDLAWRHDIVWDVDETPDECYARIKKHIEEDK